MKKYSLIVFYNPLEGQEEDFNYWLDEQHIPELLEVEGIVAAQRFRLGMTQYHPGIQYKYLTVYDVETDDIAAFHEMLMETKKDRVRSEAVDRSNNSARYFEALGDKRFAVDSPH